MNKGRNIFLLMICLVCVSLLAFLTLLDRENSSGVVDNVRYYLVSTEDDIKTYEFYFHEGDKTTADVNKSSDGTWTVMFEEWDYIYIVSGTDRENASVEAIPAGNSGVENSNAAELADPFGIYTEKLFTTMVFGKEDVLQFWQAIVVAVIAVLGGVFIMFAEELWHLFKRKSKDEYPQWKEMTVYKVIGGMLLAAAVIVLLVFIFT